MDWRKVMMKNKEVDFSRRMAFKAAGVVLSNAKLFRVVEKVAYKAINILPEAITENKTLDPWAAHRKLPEVKNETFREWYIKNRTSNEPETRIFTSATGQFEKTHQNRMPQKPDLRKGECGFEIPF